MTTEDYFKFFSNLTIEMKDLDAADIRLESTFGELEYDSLDFVQIQLEVKKAFGQTVPGEKIADGTLKTLGDLCSYLATQSEEAAAA
jgi:acyl carrier protein